MSLVLLFHYLLLNMFWMLVHPSSGACDLLWIYFMCCIALVRCVLVLQCGSAGLVWYLYAGWSSASACISEIKLHYLYLTIKMMHSPINIKCSFTYGHTVNSFNIYRQQLGSYYCYCQWSHLKPAVVVSVWKTMQCSARWISLRPY